MASERLCTVEGCGKPHVARGTCGKHYQSAKKAGRHGPLPTKKTGLDWLREHASYDGTECLTWPFSIEANGYGKVSVLRKRRWAHRVMCLVAHGEPPTEKHEAAHSCGRGSSGCVHPAHLRWATSTENLEDKKNHGGILKGSEVGNSRLSDSHAREIYALAIAGVPYPTIAQKYGVSRSHVGGIKTGKAWGWLTGA